jgi:integrase/recombinase XerD
LFIFSFLAVIYSLFPVNIYLSEIKQEIAAMKVHLRQRKQTKKGKISLFLEFYKGSYIDPDGKVKKIREYEYLDLYLIDKPKNPIDKQSNIETLQLANNIKSKREIEIANGQYGFRNSFKEKTNFIDYFKKQAEIRKSSIGNFGNWDSSIKHLERFAGSNLTFKEIDQSFCENFKNYLIKAKTKSEIPKVLSSNAAASYFNKFRACLKQAVKEKIILSNPCDDVTAPKVVESKREYLSLDELKKVAKTDCRYDVLKRAFLFSCLTGLRWSDIQKLKWSEVENYDGRYRIKFHQQKTKGLQYLDISDQAVKYLGEVGSSDDRVFFGLKYSAYMNTAIEKWMMKAGITKDITFHCARHTFAVIQLTLGTDIFTLSKLLGHSELKTTQIYAKIIDEKKVEAVNRIPDIEI